MMHNPPMNQSVYWNANEKIIGVVGVAPAATADFYHKLIRLTPVKKDWEHVRVIIDSNPKIPSRGRYLELGETDPVPYIRHSIQNLCGMGASIIAVPCNTAHILYERYTENLPVIIPNMIEVTAKALMRAEGKVPRSVAVFASKLTHQYQLYHTILQVQGIKLIETTAHQAEISRLIEQIKQGQPIDILRNEAQTLFGAYAHADAFILGCTELSLLIQQDFAGIPVIDSNMVLAEACLVLSGNDTFNQQCKSHTNGVV